MKKRAYQPIMNRSSKNSSVNGILKHRLGSRPSQNFELFEKLERSLETSEDLL